MDNKNLMHEDDEDEMEVVILDEDDEDDDRLESDQREASDRGEDGGEENLRQLRRKRQKQRQRENMKKTREENTNLMRELAEAKERLAALESRNIQSDADLAEQRYNYALQQVKQAEAALKEAVETGDGDKAISAQRHRETSMQVAREAEEVKRRLSDPNVRKTPNLDQRTERLAQEWMRDNSWFDPTGNDEDSAIARAIDEAWAKEALEQGITPASEEYWDELDSRVKRRLGPVDRQRRKSAPPVSGRGEYSRTTTTGNRVELSPDRVKALKDANVWDDPAQRKRYIRRFQEWDRQNGVR